MQLLRKTIIRQLQVIALKYNIRDDFFSLSMQSHVLDVIVHEERFHNLSVTHFCQNSAPLYILVVLEI